MSRVNEYDSDTSAAPSPPGLKIWYGILGAPVAFALMEGLGWLVSSATCPGGGGVSYTGYPMLSNAYTILYPVFGVMLLVSLGAFFVGVSEWRRSRDEAVTAIQGWLRPDFLAAAAMLVSAIFALGVLWMCIPLFWLPQCQVMR